jgi:predicted DNA-binding antitoxin AbrB/MazE fold protein
MSQEFHAIYEHGILRPLTPFNLPESAHVTVVLKEQDLVAIVTPADLQHQQQALDAMFAVVDALPQTPRETAFPVATTTRFSTDRPSDLSRYGCLVRSVNRQRCGPRRGARLIHDALDARDQHNEELRAIQVVINACRASDRQKFNQFDADFRTRPRTNPADGCEQRTDCVPQGWINKKEVEFDL